MNQGDSRFIHSRSSCGQVRIFCRLSSLLKYWHPAAVCGSFPPGFPTSGSSTTGQTGSSTGPGMAGKEVCLSEVIGELLNLGTTVRVVTRPLEHNNSFVEKMEFFQSSGLPISVKVLDELHEKGCWVIITISAVL